MARHPQPKILIHLYILFIMTEKHWANFTLDDNRKLWPSSPHYTGTTEKIQGRSSKAAEGFPGWNGWGEMIFISLPNPVLLGHFLHERVCEKKGSRPKMLLSNPVTWGHFLLESVCEKKGSRPKMLLSNPIFHECNLIMINFSFCHNVLNIQ